MIAAAQNAPVANPPAPAEVRLGNSSISLSGPWKFTPGDSPQENGSLLWASPAFDDSNWANMDLHARPGAIDVAYGNAGYVTGWSVHGFPHLAGFAWYRLRVHLGNSPAPLWLKMPNHTDDSYQVFANGHYLGEFGRFTSSGVESFRARPLAFQLPAPDVHGDILLAIRFYMEPFVLFGGSTGDSGGMHQAPLVGLASQIESTRAQEVTERLLSIIVSVFVSILMLIAAAGGFRIWLLERSSTTYLWLTLGLLLAAVPTALLLVAFFTYALSQDAVNFSYAGLYSLSLLCWIIFWRRWFRLAGDRWLDILAVILTGAVLLTQFGYNFWVHASAHAVLVIMVLKAAFNVALGAMLFVVLLQGARKDRTGALVALPPIILLAISIFSVELLDWFHIRTSVFAFGIQISVKDVALTLLVLVVGALAARRFLSSQVSQRLERQAVEQELEQARELQQHVLIPEPVASSLFAVETAYHPARTVGGDFFQVISHSDGSLLIVVGDVSGKGIAAAMLVAVLVGAIRTRADQTFDPAAILNTLNDRLVGRAGGHFATCVAAHIRPGGVMLIANAGHIPPYRNGVALDLPGSLPLGIIPGTQYDLNTIQLNPSDHLTFLTDGVLEARNAEGRLLGFDQLAKISSLPPEAIAQTAINHGQDDDITVVSLRLAAAAHPHKSAPIPETSPI